MLPLTPPTGVILTVALSRTQTSGALLTNKSDAQASLERIQNFEEAFARIRSATGIEDIEELVRESHLPSGNLSLKIERICYNGIYTLNALLKTFQKQATSIVAGLTQTQYEGKHYDTVMIDVVRFRCLSLSSIRAQILLPFLHAKSWPLSSGCPVLDILTGRSAFNNCMTSCDNRPIHIKHALTRKPRYCCSRRKIKVNTCRPLAEIRSAGRYSAADLFFSDPADIHAYSR